MRSRRAKRSPRTSRRGSHSISRSSESARARPTRSSSATATHATVKARAISRHSVSSGSIERASRARRRFARRHRACIGDRMTIESELAELGSALGGLAWVQGPGGNVSIKTETEARRESQRGRFSRTSPCPRTTRAFHSWTLHRNALRRWMAPPTLHSLPSSQQSRRSKRIFMRSRRSRRRAHACARCPPLCVLERAIRTRRRGRRHVDSVRASRSRCRARDPRGAPRRHRAHRRASIARHRGHRRDGVARAIELTRAFDTRTRARFGDPRVPIEADGRNIDVGILQAIAIEGGVARILPRAHPAHGAREVSLPRCRGLRDRRSLADRSDADAAATALATLMRACVSSSTRTVNRHAVARDEVRLRQTCEVAAAHDWLEDALSARGQESYLAPDEPEKIVAMPSEQYRIRLETKR